MARVGEAEIEYESDPAEKKWLLGRRRREVANDNEEGEGEAKPIIVQRAPIHSDESDDQGGAADYDDDKVEEEDSLNGEEDEDDDEEEEEEVREKEIEGRKAEEMGEEKVEEGEEGKKENEPFAVPTTGAFYIHDDRFRDSAGVTLQLLYASKISILQGANMV
ncbi:hypothetical protein D5086_001612 [Populus alba]|uniref:Uncharacterized protein n=1 Tax=Populus alba TaxID=43335 RepID=A0ACC4CZ58_POPAL